MIFGIPLEHTFGSGKKYSSRKFFVLYVRISEVLKNSICLTLNDSVNFLPFVVIDN